VAILTVDTQVMARREDLRVVIMSATLEASLFSSFFKYAHART
jgi:HrpA-like RNA helicase